MEEFNFLRIEIAPVDAIHGSLMDASASGIFIAKKKSGVDPEVEDPAIRMRPMRFSMGKHGQKTSFHVMGPIIISHKIDRHSPLYKWVEGQVEQDFDFEVIVTVAGSTGYDGGTVVQRTSYTSSEIRIAREFTFDNVFKERGDYIAINDRRKESS